MFPIFLALILIAEAIKPDIINYSNRSTRAIMIFLIIWVMVVDIINIFK